MKIRHPLLIRIAAFVAAMIIRVWMSTLRVRIISADGRQHPINPQTERLVYAFWHESLLAPLVTRTKVRVLISQHRDGELIAQCCSWLGIGVVRGSTSRGGSQALLEMIRAGEGHAHLAITPDGPQGPRRQLQPGVVMVASQTGLSVAPLGVGFMNAWRLKSWDRFALPKPFSTMIGVVGQPITIPKDLDRSQIAAWKQTVQDELLSMTALAEDWAERLNTNSTAAPPFLSVGQSLRQSA
jgi:lysophospholipid acyltransferase (LPLAT)-like uncharacterized protein